MRDQNELGSFDPSVLPSDLVPGGIIVYYADGDEEIIHANQYVIDLFECESFEDFMVHTGGTFRGFVQGSDISSTEDSIWGQVDKRNGLDHIYYQICTKTGRLKTVDDYGRLVQRPGERPVFYVFVVEMERDSVIDWLTGLPGMDRFTVVAEIEARAIRARGERPAMVVFDFMGMKTFNALSGREEGDRLLRAFASILRQHFGSELCCRYAGDSFCALSSADAIERQVSAVFREFAAPEVGGTLPVMAGACVFDDEDDISLQLDRAKYACDSDRSTWKSHLSWFTDEMHSEAIMRLHVLENIDRAIREGWIQPYYQGIVRSTTGRVCGEEALARWIDPVFGPLSPAQFIPALEEAGLLHKLDLHIMECVLSDLANRRKLGQELVPVSINLSLRDLKDVTFASDLARRADELNIPHEFVRIEFTESAATDHPELLKALIDALHGKGFEVWMDDFGSGFSSLNVLKEFDFDLIKLDMGFFSGEHDAKRTIIVEGVIRAAKHLGVLTLAEGVESLDHVEELVGMGCDMLQGFLYYTPSPCDVVIDYLDSAGKHFIEPHEEASYWDRVGSVSLSDLASGPKDATQEMGLYELPAGVFELRGETWHLLRATGALLKFLSEHHRLSDAASFGTLATFDLSLDPAFEDAVARCRASGKPERIAGPIEYGSGFQFSIMPLAHCASASAFLVTSTRSALGSALGIYGDVPVAYAVFRVLPDETGTRAQDAEYVYANTLFAQWGGFGEANLIGRRLLEQNDPEGPRWLALCERAVLGGEGVHDVAYSSKAGHWLSFNVTPSYAEGYCIFAFALADAEQKEREELIQAGTHDPLTDLLNRRGIDDAVKQRMQQHPEDPFVLILLDVDDFKTINDLYGHDVGDEALRSLSRELKRTFPETAVVGRNGGDEALVALFGADAQQADVCLQTLTSKDLSFELHGSRYPLSISAGYAWYQPGGDLAETYTKADEALYAVKFEGKSGYRGWNPSMSESPQRSLLGFTTRELAEGMPLAMIAHRPDGEILFANEGFAHLIGYDRLANALAELGRNLSAMFVPEDWQRLERTIASCSAEATRGTEFELGLHMLKQGGDRLSVIYRARYIKSEEKGSILYAYIVAKHLEVHAA